jgi:hypothetical protein
MYVMRARDAAAHGWFDEIDQSRAASTIDAVRSVLTRRPLPIAIEP